MGTFEDLKKKIHSTSNSNFHFDKLDWVARVWIKGLCDLIDSKEKAGDECVGCEYYSGLKVCCRIPSLTPCSKEDNQEPYTDLEYPVINQD